MSSQKKNPISLVMKPFQAFRSASKRKKLATLAGIAAAALLAVGITGAASSAQWSATQTGNAAHAQTGNASLLAAGGNSTDHVKIDSTGLVPGKSVTRTFTVTNTGDTPLALSLTNITKPTANPAKTDAELGQMSATIDGVPVDFTQPTHDLGVTLPAHSGPRTFTVVTMLALAAGNGWQNTGVYTTFDVHGDQA